MTSAGAETSKAQTKLVCFYLHGQEYAAVINDIKEAMVVCPITRVFLTPSWLLGIINLRGDVVAVLDLAQLLGLPPTNMSDSSRILIARHHGQRSGQAETVAGILVDGMAELRSLVLDELQPPPPTLSAEGATLLRGVATVEEGDALRVLNLAALFESEHIRAFQRQL